MIGLGHDSLQNSPTPTVNVSASVDPERQAQPLGAALPMGE
jgi:hypothetical protein